MCVTVFEKRLYCTGVISRDSLSITRRPQRKR
jgi:hypothetical protein